MEEGTKGMTVSANSDGSVNFKQFPGPFDRNDAWKEQVITPRLEDEDPRVQAVAKKVLGDD